MCLVAVYTVQPMSTYSSDRPFDMMSFTMPVQVQDKVLGNGCLMFSASDVIALLRTGQMQNLSNAHSESVISPRIAIIKV